VEHSPEAAYAFEATCPPGLEPVLAEELSGLGLPGEVRRGAVAFSGDSAAGARACLWLRTASRVFVVLGRAGGIEDGDGLYRALRNQVDWPQVFPGEATLSVQVVGRTRAGDDPRFLTLRAKDAIVDAFRSQTGHRPNVDRKAPDVRIQVLLRKGEARIGLDLSGAPLHRRGPGGRSGGVAPVKENIAAGVLLLAGWPNRARAGQPLVDPMCGSGTFLVEAARIARDWAPGLGRRRWGFAAWRAHRPEAFAADLAEAEARRDRSRGHPLRIRGWDGAPQAVRLARENLSSAGFGEEEGIEVARGTLADLRPGAGTTPGLLVVNPPYGARLGDEASLTPLYAELGDVLRHRFLGWDAFILAGSRTLAGALGLRPRRRYPVLHGGLDARVLEVRIDPTAPAAAGGGPGWRRPTDDAEMLRNRLRKNLRRLKPWLRRGEVGCYRVYDRDVPEYALTIERYEDEAVLWEWAPPPSVPGPVAAARRQDALTVVPETLGLPSEALHFKVRSRGAGGRHYGKLAETGRRKRVREGDLRLWVNLEDYLDTGLFLDHREVRRLLRDEAAVRRGGFLNLFAYTCSATCAAALGGANRTTSVDLSPGYLDWGRSNLEENGVPVGDRHRLVQQDVAAFLDQCRDRFALIFCAPPTFSRSHRGAGTQLDLQRDQGALLHRCLDRLAPGGLLVFSAPTRGFSLDRDALPAGIQVEDRSAALVPFDFAKSPDAPRTFLIHRA